MRMPNAFAMLGVVAVMACAPAFADGLKPAIAYPTIGDTAPDFAIPKDLATGSLNGAERLSDLRGRRVLLAFYPKAFSPGCIKQLSQYRDDNDVFLESNTVVIAISADPQERSDKFRESQSFPFPVVGDPQQAVIHAYGVPTKTYLGVAYAQRSVFLIDECGIIRYIEMDYSVVDGKTELYDRIHDLALRTRQTKATGAEAPTPMGGCESL